MYFRNLRRRRRRPSTAAFLLDLDLAFDDVPADLVLSLKARFTPPLAARFSETGAMRGR